MSNCTVGSIAYSPNYGIQPPQRVAAKTVEEELVRVRREVCQLRRVAGMAAAVVSQKNRLFDLVQAINLLDESLQNYTQDKE